MIGILFGVFLLYRNPVTRISRTIFPPPLPGIFGYTAFCAVVVVEGATV